MGSAILCRLHKGLYEKKKENIIITEKKNKPTLSPQCGPLPPAYMNNPCSSAILSLSFFPFLLLWRISAAVPFYTPTLPDSKFSLYEIIHRDRIQQEKEQAHDYCLIIRRAYKQEALMTAELMSARVRASLPAQATVDAARVRAKAIAIKQELQEGDNKTLASAVLADALQRAEKDPLYWVLLAILIKEGVLTDLHTLTEAQVFALCTHLSILDEALLRNPAMAAQLKKHGNHLATSAGTRGNYSLWAYLLHHGHTRHYGSDNIWEYLKEKAARDKDYEAIAFLIRWGRVAPTAFDMQYILTQETFGEKVSEKILLNTLLESDPALVPNHLNRSSDSTVQEAFFGKAQKALGTITTGVAAALVGSGAVAYQKLRLKKGSPRKKAT